MVNLMSANNQWARRPADERFWGLEDLAAEMDRQKQCSAEWNADLRSLRAAHDGKDVALVKSNGASMKLSNWAFTQLCGRFGAPANYLRELSPELTVQNLNYGFQKLSKDKAEAGLLLYKEQDYLVRALTSQKYGRIWNSDLVRKLTPALEKGWMVPPARPATMDPRARKATSKDIVPGQEKFGLAVQVGDEIAPAGVYAGDRDLFVFMVNPNKVINDGNKGLMRGVFIWNSEVGLGSFKVKTFYLENVCGNHIVWNASNIREIKIVHRQNSILGFDDKTMQVLHKYANMSATVEEGMIKKARTIELGKDRYEVIESLFANKALGFTKKDLEGSYDSAEQWEHTALSSPNTLWGMVHGITRYSQHADYADERNGLDVAAGKLLAMAA